MLIHLDMPSLIDLRRCSLSASTPAHSTSPRSRSRDICLRRKEVRQARPLPPELHRSTYHLATSQYQTSLCITRSPLQYVFQHPHRRRRGASPNARNSNSNETNTNTSPHPPLQSHPQYSSINITDDTVRRSAKCKHTAAGAGAGRGVYA